jgi:hypothetical protein
MMWSSRCVRASLRHDSPAPIPHVARHSGFRFTLAGILFVFIVGVSIGLAYGRLPDVAFSSAMLASFTVWLAMGLLQSVRRTVRQFMVLSDQRRQVRGGLVFQAVIPIWTLFLLATVGACELARRYGALNSPWIRPLSDLLFFTAIVSAYWSPTVGHIEESRRARIFRTLVASLFILSAAFWGTKIVAANVHISQIVYAAIRRIELAQPTTWSGRPFNPDRLTWTADQVSQTFEILSAAATLLGCAVAAVVLAHLVFRSAPRLQLALLAAWMACLGAAAACILASYNAGHSELSPFRMAPIVGMSWDGYFLLAVLLITVVSGASLNVSARVRNAANASQHPHSSPLILPLHEHAAVIGFGICAIVTAIGSNLWQNAVGMNFTAPSAWMTDPLIVWRTAIELGQIFAIDIPQWAMIRVAAGVMLLIALVRLRNRLSSPYAVWLIEPSKFIVTWLVIASTLVVAAPITVWWILVATLAKP